MVQPPPSSSPLPHPSIDTKSELTLHFWRNDRDQCHLQSLRGCRSRGLYHDPVEFPSLGLAKAESIKADDRGQPETPPSSSPCAPFVKGVASIPKLVNSILGTWDAAIDLGNLCLHGLSPGLC